MIRNLIGLMGHVFVSFNELVEEFGQPGVGDGYKVDAQWKIVTPYGIATIYNYKDGTNYNGVRGTPKEEIRHWHIGGTDIEAVNYIHKRLKK